LPLNCYKAYIPENVGSYLLKVQFLMGTVHEMFVVADVKDVQPDDYILGRIGPPLKGRESLPHPQSLQHGNILSSYVLKS
jgi:hypothetical protein